MTGVFPAFSGKLLQLLVDAISGLTRVGILRDPGSDRLSLAEVEDAARAVRVRLKILEARNRDDLEETLLATRKDHAPGLVILPAVLFALTWYSIDSTYLYLL